MPAGILGVGLAFWMVRATGRPTKAGAELPNAILAISWPLRLDLGRDVLFEPICTTFDTGLGPTKKKKVSKLLLKLISDAFMSLLPAAWPSAPLQVSRSTGPFRQPQQQPQPGKNTCPWQHLARLTQRNFCWFLYMICVFNCLFRFSFTWIGPRMSHSKQLSRHSLHRLTARSCLPQCRQTRSNLRATDWQLKLAHIRSQPKHLYT